MVNCMVGLVLVGGIESGGSGSGGGGEVTVDVDVDGDGGENNWGRGGGMLYRFWIQ